MPAGWLSLIVNAGDGIDLDMFLSRQPKERIIQRVGQQLRINQSKIKDASDTNTDFDDIDGAIPVSYTHLDVYKRQVSHPKRLRDFTRIRSIFFCLQSRSNC